MLGKEEGRGGCRRESNRKPVCPQQGRLEPPREGMKEWSREGQQNTPRKDVNTYSTYIYMKVGSFGGLSNPENIKNWSQWGILSLHCSCDPELVV